MTRALLVGRLDELPLDLLCGIKSVNEPTIDSEWLNATRA
jgi:hypothetical protein